MDKKPKGKPKKAAAPRRDSRVRPPTAKAKAAKAADVSLPFQPPKPRRKRIAPSLVGSDRPKVSLFMNRKDRDRAHAVAGSRKVSLTALLEELILAGLSKKAKK